MKISAENVEVMKKTVHRAGKQGRVMLPGEWIHSTVIVFRALPDKIMKVEEIYD